MKILVIGDTPGQPGELLSLIAATLPDAELHKASGLADALHLAKIEDPDVVLLDLEQSGSDGVECCATLKMEEALRDIPILVLLPSVAERDLRIKFMEAGAEGFLTRPFDETDLVTQVKVMVKAKLGGRFQHRKDGRDREPATDDMHALQQEVEACRRRERRLEHLLSQWQSTFDAIHDVVWILDKDFRVVQCNKATEALLKRPAADIIGSDCWKLFHGSPKPPHDCLASRLRKSLKRETMEDEVGGRWYAASADPIMDKDGRLAGVVHVLADITQRKQAESERERLITAIEQAAEIVVITDPSGNIQYVNPAFETVTGYGRDEIVGKNPRILKSGKQDEAFYRNLWETISSGHIWQGRMVNKRKDQTLFTEEATISPVRDPGGRIVNYVAVKHDITRDLELEQQIRQSVKMEAIGQLAGGVSHDFNNILQAMMGYSQMLVELLPKDHDTSEYAREIALGVERAAALTRQLLLFSRRQALKMESLDLNLVIENLLKMLRRIIGEDIRLEWMPGNDLGAVYADAGMLEQVLMNLCVNARDAMGRGGNLHVETQNVLIDSDYCANHVWAIPGRYVLLSVTDNGCGMDPATLDHVFEPFFTTKEAGEGTGLGLATVYGIVKQHKGMITVYSEPDKGTTFKVYLPLCERRAVSVGPLLEGPVSGGSETILLAEDDDAVRDLASRILRRAGYFVLEARDGEDAVAMFKRHASQVDLLFMDVVMPRMGGYDAFERIREISPDIRALFSSGYSENAVHTNFVLKQGVHLVQKPYSPNVLLRRIRQALGSDTRA